MRLDWFWIGDYKNLKDVTVDFDQDHWVTVVIGWNGTGKSNVLEALATLFRDLVMGENLDGDKNHPTFPYKLCYECQGQWVYIDADPKREKEVYAIRVLSKTDRGDMIVKQDELVFPRGKKLDPSKIGETVSITQFLKQQDLYLPRYVFGYYSGTSNRLQEVFRKYLARYDKDLRGGKDPGMRRLFYALPVHSQFVLLAFILQQDHEAVKQLLDTQLGLEENGGIDSILFVLKQPSWDKTKDQELFWGAEGIVRNFLDRLHKIALAPLRLSRRVETTLWNKKKRGFRYLYVKDLSSLRELVGEQSPSQFFRDLESTYVSEMIEEVRIRVKLRKNDDSVTFRELSEGEQQLLTVLGLLRFTAEDESLFLLDEPDTHLNPKWCVDYLQHLRDFVGDSEKERSTSHIVMTTHNPLAVAELVKGQVQILKRDPDTFKIMAGPPEMDPRGMGYSGIVTSDMFGLAAALDNHTRELLEEKRTLAGKEGPLTTQERDRLEQINLEMEGYGFRYEMRDPVFAEYLRARYAAEQQAPEGQRMIELTPAERKEKAKRLVEKALQHAGEAEN
ncbi:MAG: AAA family ATPase [Nitrospira sp.]|nr:AAA family ATPase [Nitrospira sp.]MCA9466303.1 AAA family ATPase [Nitrospira sp.]